MFYCVVGGGGGVVILSIPELKPDCMSPASASLLSAPVTLLCMAKANTLKASRRMETCGGKKQPPFYMKPKGKNIFILFIFEVGKGKKLKLKSSKNTGEYLREIYQFLYVLKWNIYVATKVWINILNCADFHSPSPIKDDDPTFTLFHHLPQCNEGCNWWTYSLGEKGIEWLAINQ